MRLSFNIKTKDKMQLYALTFDHNLAQVSFFF